MTLCINCTKEACHYGIWCTEHVPSLNDQELASEAIIAAITKGEDK